MIEALAEKVAVSIKKADSRGTVSVAVMKYALIIVINFTIPVAASLAIGLVTDAFYWTSLTICAFTLLRAFSGGFHFRSPVLCMIATTVITATPAHFVLSKNLIILLTIIGLFLIAILAPANIKGYARMPEKFFPLMKMASIVIVGSNFFIQSSAFAILFFAQGLLLIFPFKKEVSL
ncbi:accessory gene regulator B family protein [Paenibacillus flagellatus]|uniref:accessory gene regulator B family protein n=1 Tax=Paenibacillus flagellatus TaxID=2211139 RepID=UPI00130545E0|nr:accessory gene regulator B family protein [Paenibacillus flagellatus]